MNIKGFGLNVFNYWSEKLPLSQKLRYFRGSRFSQCFILSTALHCSLPSFFFILTTGLSDYQKCQVPLKQVQIKQSETKLLKTAVCGIYSNDFHVLPVNCFNIIPTFLINPTFNLCLWQSIDIKTTLILFNFLGSGSEWNFLKRFFIVGRLDGFIDEYVSFPSANLMQLLLGCFLKSSVSFWLFKDTGHYW